MTIQETVSEINDISPPKYSLDFFNTAYQNIHSQSFINTSLSKFEKVSSIEKLEDLPEIDDQTLYNDIVSVKLNGGLGTSLKSSCVKSCLNVNSTQTILDKFISDMKRINVPTVLMNSPFTQDQTMRNLQNLDGLELHFLTQSKFPRLLKDSLKPFQSQNKKTLNWNPIGHAEIYFLLYDSGLLHQFKDANKKYLFISNIDNIYATINLQILNYVKQNKFDFLMEVTPKTSSDLKGGILVQDKHSIKLIELAQINANDLQDFYDLTKFKVFNTNNIWVSIEALINLIESNSLKTDVIYNHKTVEDKEIVQIESAMGSAIQSFLAPCLLEVPRSRFFPIKSINDLFLLRSIQNSPLQKSSRLPFIQVANSIDSVDTLDNRFNKLPNISKCKSLTLNGHFESKGNFTIDGDVSLTTTSTKLLTEFDHYENCMVTYD